MLPIARSKAITEGLFGGNRRWLVLGGLAWAWRALQWARQRDEEVVYRAELAPGETLVLSREGAHPPRRRSR